MLEKCFPARPGMLGNRPSCNRPRGIGGCPEHPVKSENILPWGFLGCFEPQFWEQGGSAMNISIMSNDSGRDPNFWECQSEVTPDLVKACPFPCSHFDPFHNFQSLEFLWLLNFILCSPTWHF